MNERNTVALQPADTAAWFIWEQGLRGPVPVIITPDCYQYLSATDWKKKTIVDPIPINTFQLSLGLDALADAFRNRLPKIDPEHWPTDKPGEMG